MIKSLTCLFVFLLPGLLTENNLNESTSTPLSAYKKLPLEKLHLPDGFKISIYAEVPNARSLDVSPSGIVFVGNRSQNKVYALVDSNQDFKADGIYVIDKGLNMPNGVAFKDGDLYVAEVNRILVYRDIENHLSSPPKAEVVYDKYPTEKHHGWKNIAFGPDGLLYVPVGAPCNICEPKKPIYASITRLDVNHPDPEVIAHGVRNSVGFDWDPQTGDLWFTDNGRDMLGDDVPPCELNHVEKVGENFGFPYCHGGTILDPEYGKGKNCEDYSAPAWNFHAHVAPLGMMFYKGSLFPSDYVNDIFVAQHGSWNRSKKIGYRVMRVKHNDKNATSATVFIDGWLDDDSQQAWGRPVDIIQLKDGSMLISDDYADVVYRVFYAG